MLLPRRSWPWVAILVTAVPLSGPVRADPVKDDLQKLQGAWAVVSAEGGGQPREDLKKTRITFEGDVITVHTGDNLKRGKVKLDPAREPRQLTIQPEDRDEPLLGIYAFARDGLRLCVGDLGEKSRPEKFATAAGTRHVLFELTKEKKP